MKGDEKTRLDVLQFMALHSKDRISKEDMDDENAVVCSYSFIIHLNFHMKLFITI